MPLAKLASSRSISLSSMAREPNLLVESKIAGWTEKTVAVAIALNIALVAKAFFEGAALIYIGGLAFLGLGLLLGARYIWKYRQVTDLTQNVQRLERANQQLNSIHTTLKNNLQGLTQEKQDLHQENQKLHQTGQTLQEEVEHFKQHSQTLSNSIEDMKVENAQLAQNNLSFKEEIQSLTIATQRMQEKLEAENERFKQNNISLTKNVYSLENNVSLLETQRLALQDQIHELEQVKENLRKQMESSLASFEQLLTGKPFLHLQEETGNLSQKLESFNQTLQTLLNDEALFARIEMVHKSADKLQELAITEAQKITTLEHLTQECERRLSSIETLKEEFKKLHQQYAETQQRLSDSVTTLASKVDKVKVQPISLNKGFLNDKRIHGNSPSTPGSIQCKRTVSFT